MGCAGAAAHVVLPVSKRVFLPGLPLLRSLFHVSRYVPSDIPVQPDVWNAWLQIDSDIPTHQQPQLEQQQQQQNEEQQQLQVAKEEQSPSAASKEEESGGPKTRRKVKANADGGGKGDEEDESAEEDEEEELYVPSDSEVNPEEQRLRFPEV